VASSRRWIEILGLVKNNVGLDLKACPARIFLVCPDDSVKNIVAKAQLILIEGFPGEHAPPGACKEHPFGDFVLTDV
jgi:hypothetical protein